MMKKLGEVVGLGVNKNKLLSAQKPTAELPMASQWNTTKGTSNEIRLVDDVLPDVTGQTQILYKGKLLSLTPKSDSMTISQAADWYRAEMNKLAGMIDKTLPIEAQVKQAAQLGEELMNGAIGGMYTPEVASILRETFARPSIEQLTTELSATFAGSKLQEAILQKLAAPVNKARQWFESGACFIAGTLVHTKEGLVPIEKLKVGDLVLSRPENPEQGIELAYKRVVKTFVHEDKEIQEVSCRNTPRRQPGSIQERFFATLDHPFWVEGEGWTAASLLRELDLPIKLSLLGDSIGYAGSAPVYQTDRPGIGWLTNAGWEGHGATWSFDEDRWLESPSYFDTHNWPYDDEGEVDGEGYFYRTTVYNIEVEDYHTYFVGERGVWVHNANCDITLFKTTPPNAPQRPDLKLLVSCNILPLKGTLASSCAITLVPRALLSCLCQGQQSTRACRLKNSSVR